MPPSESSPLLHPISETRRPRWAQVCGRFCVIAASSVFSWLCFLAISSLVLHPLSRHVNHHHSHGVSGSFLPLAGPQGGSARGNLTGDGLIDFVHDFSTIESIEASLRYYTSGAHLAGQNLSQARWTCDRWREWGIDADIVSYDVYLNRPVDHRLALLRQATVGADGRAQGVQAWSVIFEASLEEDVLPEDPTTADPHRTPTFHAYSAPGNVTAPFVWVNYATPRDFEDLRRANVSLAGNIALARYGGGIMRSLKVQGAEEHHMVGMVMYSDPGNDGLVTEANGFEPYPKGPARNPSSVQRGSVALANKIGSDPTTPGYPSKPGAPRLPPDDFLPHIPTLPISYADALPFLKALNSHGPLGTDLGSAWGDCLGLAYHGVEYNIGPSPSGVVANLFNDQIYAIKPIYNVIGSLNGTSVDEAVIVGNHRDAWSVSGAVDPNGGTAVLNEAVRAFGAASQAGWRPRRTMLFASWDGEEYLTLGSGEWVEEFLPWLSHAAVAYVNIDEGALARRLSVKASPLMRRLVRDVASRVKSPNDTVPGQTVLDAWGGQMRPPGGGTDYVAFQNYAGVASAYFEFGSASHRILDEPVHHYHSNYDSLTWLLRYGDPGLLYGRTHARLTAVMLARLADEPVVPFNATDYAADLAGYVDDVQALVEDMASSAGAQRKHGLTSLLRPLRRATVELAHAAARQDSDAASLAAVFADPAKLPPWWKWRERRNLQRRLAATNRRYRLLDRSFVHEKGLDGRPWFRHAVFAPGLRTGYDGQPLPGLVETAEARDWARFALWAGVLEGMMKNATKLLDD